MGLCFSSVFPTRTRFPTRCFATSNSVETTHKIIHQKPSQVFNAIALMSPPDEDEPEINPHFEGGNVTLVTTKDVWDRKLSEAKTQGKIVIANFSASWCGPCKSLAPYYIELSETHPSLMFLTVDVDELTEFSTQWEVKATPTFFFLKDGQQFDKIVGANKPELQKKITAIVESQVPAGQK